MGHAIASYSKKHLTYEIKCISPVIFRLPAAKMLGTPHLRRHAFARMEKSFFHYYFRRTWLPSRGRYVFSYAIKYGIMDLKAIKSQ